VKLSVQEQALRIFRLAQSLALIPRIASGAPAAVCEFVEAKLAVCKASIASGD
jgi:hypothetical protein